MGQKVHPYGFRLGYNKNWQSRWFSKKDYPAFVYEDHEVRKYVKKLLYSAGISKMESNAPGAKSASSFPPPAPVSSLAARAWKLKSFATTCVPSSDASSLLK